MGYSCTAKADYVLKELLTQLQAAGPAKTSNGWSKNNIEYFFEIGKEQPDGAITGKVHKVQPDGLCREMNSARIDADGDIPYFPTSKQAQRDAAMTAGLIKFHEIHGGRWQDDKLLSSLIGDAKFVVI
jgi:hypothetical protein